MKRLFKTMLFLTLTAVLLAALSACACNGQTATPSPAPTAMTATPAPAPTESILPSPEAPDATPESPASPESSAEPGSAIDYDALKTEVEKLSEIDTCDVVAHGGKAIAGVTFDAQYQGTLTDRIEEMVREKITAKDAGITEVAVTADPTLCTEIRTLAAETAGKAMTAEQVKKFDELFGKISPAGSPPHPDRFLPPFERGEPEAPRALSSFPARNLFILPCSIDVLRALPYNGFNPEPRFCPRQRGFYFRRNPICPALIPSRSPFSVTTFIGMAF